MKDGICDNIMAKKCCFSAMIYSFLFREEAQIFENKGDDDYDENRCNA